MKHFLFTIAEDKRGRNKQLKLYVIGRNGATLVGKYEYTYEDDSQACYNAIEQHRALPQSFLDKARHPMGGRDYGMLLTRCTIHNLSHTEIR